MTVIPPKLVAIIVDTNFGFAPEWLQKHAGCYSILHSHHACAVAPKMNVMASSRNFQRLISSYFRFDTMGLLPDTQYRGLRMRRGCRERFSRHRLQWKPLVSDPGMHHSTCVTHVPWCMSGSLNSGGGENVPGIPCAWATRFFRIWQEAH